MTPDNNPNITLKTLQDLEKQGNYREIVQLLGSVNFEDLSEQYQAIYTFALFQSEDHSDAEKLMLQLIASETVDARAYLGLSIIHGQRQQIDDRLKCADLGLKCSPDLFHKSWLMCSKARALIEKKLSQEALEILHNALELLPMSEYRARARCFYFLSSTYASLDDFGQQEYYSIQGLKLYEIISTNTEEISIMMDLGYRYYYKNQIKDSLDYINQSVFLSEKFDTSQLPESLIQRIEINLLEQKLSEALKDIKQLKSFQQERGYCRLRLIVQCIEAECLLRSQKITQIDFENRIHLLEPITAFDQTVQKFYCGLINFTNGHTEASTSDFKSCLDGSHQLDSFRIRAQAFLAALEWQEKGILNHETKQLLKLLSTVGGRSALKIDVPTLKNYYQHCFKESSSDNTLKALAQVFSSLFPTIYIKLIGEKQLFINDHALKFGLSKSYSILAFLDLEGPKTPRQINKALWGNEEKSPSSLKRLTKDIRDSFMENITSISDLLEKEGNSYKVRDNIYFISDPKIIKEAIDSSNSYDWIEAVGLFKKQFQLSQTDDQCQWVQNIYQSLEKYVTAMLFKLGDHHFKTNPLQAFSYYHEIINYDKINQEAWKKSIFSLLRAGDYPRAKLIAKLCREITREELDEDVDWPFLDIEDPDIDNEN